MNYVKVFFSDLTVQQLFNEINKIRMQHPMFQVWLKEDVPKEFHYKNNRRIGPIVLMEHLGYVVLSHFETKSLELPPQGMLFGRLLCHLCFQNAS